MVPAYVVKAERLVALNYLPDDCPRPCASEWINRGTDQRLRQTSVDMLLRTLFLDAVSPSVRRLRQTSGLRITFQSENERQAFARAFARACEDESALSPHILNALFQSHRSAEQAVVELKDAGVPDSAISILWKVGQFTKAEESWPSGHSKMSVASAVAGGGFAGAILGVVILAIPGVGPIAAAGAISVSAMSSLSAAIGATGGAIARMLTDYDVDDVAARHCERQIRSGKTFVSVDTRQASGLLDVVRSIFVRLGGEHASQHLPAADHEDFSSLMQRFNAA